MSDIKIEFPDGSIKEYQSGITGEKVVTTISEGLARKTICYSFDDVLRDLREPIVESGKIKFLTFDDPQGRDVFRHSSAHLMAQAIKRMFPQAKLTIGPVVKDGFYYDVDIHPLKQEDLDKIEAEMKNIVSDGLEISRKEVSVAEAKKIFEGNEYKQELLDELAEDDSQKITIYSQGEFSDLCRGPHVPSTKMIKAFKLTKTSSAYWRGDAKNKSLQRIYGVSFPDKKLLKEYLHNLQEALLRDHNKLGQELDLFITSPLVGQGLPIFTPKGTKIFKRLTRWIEDVEEKRGYLLTKTPLLAKSDLYKVSGHWDHYKDGMFLVNASGDEMALRPMTCPFQFQIYNSKKRSYRELPLRYNETSTLFRNESSGEMHGLIRVRQFTISEAHVICAMDQLNKEFKDVVQLFRYVMDTLGLTDYKFRFSKWDPAKKEKYIDNPAAWENSQKILKSILDELELVYEEADDEAAFYGPKLDIQMTNVFGKEDTVVTIQIDFALPERFNMTYVDSSNSEKMPIIIHRTSIGCYERTIALLIEKTMGNFPLWLNPNQVKILMLADRHLDFANDVKNSIDDCDADIRADIDARAETIGKKIREAQLAKYNYILVIGDKEVESKTINVRTREGNVEGSMSVSDFMARVVDEIKSKKR